MYPFDSLRFNSIHNTQVNLLRVTYRLPPFTPFAFLPFATRGEGQVYFYKSNAKYIFITFVVSREVFTCTHLEGIVVSYTFDFYLHNLLVPVSETVRYSWS